MEKTAGILTIGNEVLSGKVADENTPYLCRELRELGVEVRGVVILPDDEAAIAEQVRAWSGRWDFLFVCGGMGPTPDDVTIAGIARGLGRKVLRHPRLLALIRDYYPPPHTEPFFKMAEVPEGAELLFSEGLTYPVVSVGGIYVLPGVPTILQKKFAALRERFRSAPFFLKKIFLNAAEVQIAACLSDLLARYPKISLGSYPVLSAGDFKVVLILESKDPRYLDQTFLHLMSLLPRESVVKTE